MQTDYQDDEVMIDKVELKKRSQCDRSTEYTEYTDLKDFIIKSA